MSELKSIKILVKDGMVVTVDWAELDIKDSNPINIIAMLNVAIQQVSAHLR